MTLTRRFFVFLAFAASVVAQTTANGPIVFLIGPPGSGKTTQAEFLKSEYGIPTIAVEDLIKDNPAAFPKREGITGMEPHSDPILNKLFGERIDKLDVKKGFALDGYPATKEHSDYLTALLKELNLPRPVIVELDIPDRTVRSRLRKRGDNPNVIEQRLKDYHREMGMMHVYFPNAVIQKVDGTKKPGDVSKKIKAIMPGGGR